MAAPAAVTFEKRLDGCLCARKFREAGKPGQQKLSDSHPVRIACERFALDHVMKDWSPFGVTDHENVLSRFLHPMAPDRTGLLQHRGRG